MNRYIVAIQLFIPLNHQIIVFTITIKSYRKHEHIGSKTNQNRRLSAKSGLHARKATRQQPVVQITAQGGNRCLVQGKHRNQQMV